MNKKDNIDFWKEGLKNSSSAFKTPDSYFDDLENNILNKTVLAKKTPSTKIFSINSWITIGVASAAALIIAFVLLFPHNNSLPLELAFEDEMELYAYDGDAWIEEELAEMPMEEIDAFVDEEIDNLLADGVTSDEIFAAYYSKN